MKWTWVSRLIYVVFIAWYVSMGIKENSAAWYLAAWWCFVALLNDEMYYRVRRILIDVLTQLKMKGWTVK